MAGCLRRGIRWLLQQHRTAPNTEIPTVPLDPLWDELFPAEQARIVRLLVERVDVGPTGADIRLRTAGLAGLVRDLGALGPDALKAAAA
jgi:hypothetical protein